MIFSDRRLLKSLNTIWYLTLIYISITLISYGYSAWLYWEDSFAFADISYTLYTLLFGGIILFCVYQFKEIGKALTLGEFFSYRTVTLFKRIAYATFLSSTRVYISFLSLTHVKTTISSTGKEPIYSYTNYFKDAPFRILFSTSSPITYLLLALVLGMCFLLIAKTIDKSVIMKNEIDETV